MEKEKLKTVGAGPVSAQKGITLIALVITIIVMLILVAVTITMAVNGGLFEYAQSAGRQTNEAKDAEQLLASGQVNIDNVIYNSIDEYIETTKGTGNKEPLPKYEEANFSNGYLTENADYTSGSYTAVIPAGFKVSEVDGESTITTGLVIKDAEGNEFVWIPVTTKELDNSYVYQEGYLEPAQVEEDAGKGYNFTSEYHAMVSSVNTNNGFYIGRYETTIDSNSKIGSKYNTPILTSTNWYTLYETQKGLNVNVPGKGTNVQTAMVYGVLWDETMAFISQNDTDYDVNSSKSGWKGHSDESVYYSGILNLTDVGQNIWGLGSSFSEWTQESALGKERVVRSLASVDTLYSAFVRNNNDWGSTPKYTGCYVPSLSGNGVGTRVHYVSSRLIMYVL